VGDRFLLENWDYVELGPVGKEGQEAYNKDDSPKDSALDTRRVIFKGFCLYLFRGVWCFHVPFLKEAREHIVGHTSDTHTDSNSEEEELLLKFKHVCSILDSLRLCWLNFCSMTDHI